MSTTNEWERVLLQYFETGRLERKEIDYIDRLKADAIAQAVQAEWKRDGPLLTCPWCQTGLVGKIGDAQITHLIDCGDAYRAALRARPGEGAKGRLREIVAGAHAIRCTCLPERRDPRCVELQGLQE